MKKLSLLASALIATAVMVGCYNPTALEVNEETTAKVKKTEAEMIAEKQAAETSGLRAAGVADINYISRDGKGYTSNNGTSWYELGTEVIAVSGGDQGKGNYYIRSNGEIYQNGQVIEWGDFRDVAYCAWTDEAFAIDANGDLYEMRGTEWHKDFVKFENQPEGRVVAMDLDGIGNPWVIINYDEIYKYENSKWVLKHKVDPRSAYTSMYDIAAGDEGAYVSIGVKPMGAQFSIPEIRQLKNGAKYLTSMPATMYGSKVDVASDGYRDRVYFVTQWRDFDMNDLYRYEADGSATLLVDGNVSNVGCAVYN